MCVSRDKFMDAGSAFEKLRKAVMKAKPEEIEAEARGEEGETVLMFLMGLAAAKKMFRNKVLAVCNKLIGAEGAAGAAWAATFSGSGKCQEKIVSLEDELQAAFGVQHEAMMKSMKPGAMAAAAAAPKPEQLAAELSADTESERIRAEQLAAEGAPEEAAPEPATPLDHPEPEGHKMSPKEKKFHEAIGMVCSIDDDKKMNREGDSAFSKLKIALTHVAGEEAIIEPEVDHASQVFNFLFDLLKRKGGTAFWLKKIAEVMNLLLANPGWEAAFKGNAVLKDRLHNELDAKQQAALKVGSDSAAIDECTGGAAVAAAEAALEPEIKAVAATMKSMRGGALPVPAAPAPPPPPPPAGPPGCEWKEVPTAEGHVYYFNAITKETAWERPPALGGPRTYAVGDAIEIWSNSNHCWGGGQVTGVTGDRVQASFVIPGVGEASKELPAGHKDLRPSQAEKAVWTAQESTAYDAHWAEASHGAAELDMGTAAGFLQKSGLDRQLLKQVWAAGNPAMKPALGKDEFFGCCRATANVQKLIAQSSPMLERDGDHLADGGRELRKFLLKEGKVAPETLPRFA